MLSSGESSAMVSNPTIVKSERQFKPDCETLIPSLHEPGVLFHEVYPDSVLTALKRLVFSRPVVETDACHWKSLGYWLCCQLTSLLKASDIFCQTFALKMITDVSDAFVENLCGIRQWYSILLHTHCIPKNDVLCIL